MASNRLPLQLDRLFTLCEDMEDGLIAHQAAIGILQNTAAVITPARNTALSAEITYQSARSAKPALTTAQTLADSNAKTFIATARGVLANFLGPQWSQAWAVAGFVNGSLAIPATVVERQALLATLRAYFTANPAHEAAPLVTSARADTLATALSDARSAVNAALTTIATAKTARDAAVATLRKRMRGLIDELATLLNADDPRWYAFGLNRPADPETPGIPDGLLATPGAPGILYLDWADARRAERYRVWKKITGVDTDYSPAASVTESDATLSGLPTGATVQIQITALNDAGESQPSAPVSVLVA